MKKPKNITTIFSNPDSPTSSAFIRILLPLQYVKTKKNITIVQRTAFDTLEDAKKFIEDNNNKLVVDVDDAFFSMNESHPEWELYKPKIAALEYVIKNADLVTVTNEFMKHGYSKIAKMIAIVPNTIDAKLWKKPRFNLRRNTNNKLRIIYMGTATHEKDFLMVLPALEELAKKRPGSFELTIIGVARDIPKYPWIKRIYQPKGKSVYPEFVRWFVKQGPFDVGICPLKDSKFNSAKSDIKILDYLAANIYPVASAVKPYQTDVQKYATTVKNTKAEWMEALSGVIDLKQSRPDGLKKNTSLGHDYVLKNRNSKITAEQLQKLFEEL